MAQVEGSILVAQSIQREGISTLFGLAGGPIQDIMGYAPHVGIRPIGVRHEQAATFAAAAYGLSRNRWAWRCWRPVRCHHRDWRARGLR